MTAEAHAGSADLEPITTVHIYPPIPIRQFDWCAYRDPERRPYGYGPTEQAAITDLLQEEADAADC